MSAEKFVDIVLPQIKKEKTLVTVFTIRVFRWISFLFPELAQRILTK